MLCVLWCCTIFILVGPLKEQEQLSQSQQQAEVIYPTAAKFPKIMHKQQ